MPEKQKIQIKCPGCDKTLIYSFDAAEWKGQLSNKVWFIANVTELELMCPCGFIHKIDQKTGKIT